MEPERPTPALFRPSASPSRCRRDGGRRRIAGALTLAKGDADRTMIGFRNVFPLGPEHALAWLAFASCVKRARPPALGNHVLLVEHDRDGLEGLRELAEPAPAAQDFETTRSSGART